MSVAVLIPYRPAGDQDRERACSWVTAQYAQHHPDWQLSIGDAQGEGWSKGAAVAAALQNTDSEFVVIADADAWADDIDDSVEHVRQGVRWAQPHQRVFRLTAQASERIYAGTDPRDVGGHSWARSERAHPGVSGGGIVVMRTETYRECPLDPRFIGWGGEDHSWATALTCLHGGEYRGTAKLWHLWHEPQARLSRTIGNAANEALHQRYRAARTDREHMQALLGEARELLWQTAR